jgi:hypothetical protein
MIKKLIITLLLFIGFFGISFSAWEKDDFYFIKGELADNQQELNRALTSKKQAEANIKILEALPTRNDKQDTELATYHAQKTEAEWDITVFWDIVKDQMVEYEEKKKTYIESDESDNDFSTIWFKLNVNDVFPKSKYNWETNINRRANIFFVDIIQKLMIWLGSLALLLMTIGAWFMILYHWEDSMLTKWKSIFSAGIISLIVALLSFYMVELVKYLIG